MALKTTPFKFGEFVETADHAVEYLQGALDECGAEFLPIALRTIAQSEGMAALAERSGLTRAGLYRALSENGDPKLSTLTAILEALGLRLSVVPINAA